MALFKNKYRIESTRLPNWDYGSNGKYLITLNTKDRKRYFGEVKDKKMILSEIGQVANDYWLKIPEHFSFVKLDEFIVMPDHIHGIIIIDKKESPSNEEVETEYFPSQGENDRNKDVGSFEENSILLLRENLNKDTRSCETENIPSQLKGFKKDPSSKNKFGVQSQNLGSIVRGYKAGISVYAKKNNIDFKWQERYYDKMIRNEMALVQLRNYIKNNPSNWNK